VRLELPDEWVSALQGRALSREERLLALAAWEQSSEPWAQQPEASSGALLALSV